MRPMAASIVTGLFAVCLAAAPVEEKGPGGKARGKYTVDAEGRKHGPFSEYHDNGKLRAKGAYKAGRLDGPYTLASPAGRTLATATYREGELNGPYSGYDARGALRVSMAYKAGKPAGAMKVILGGRASCTQQFKDGEPPLPRTYGEVYSALGAINPAVPPKKVGGAEAERQAALRRLQSYRAVVGIPYADLELDGEMNRHAEAAAQICEAIDRLDHNPMNPGWPEEKYQVALKGTRSSNLFGGIADLARSVDGYMDDSDPGNIDRVGHRRWCLNPGMAKTGFGKSGKYSAMWSFDRSRTDVPDYDYVSFPAPGFMPAAYFRDHFAWSVSPNPKKYRQPDPERVKVRVLHKTDASPDKPGTEVELNYRNVNLAPFGSGPAIIFRPAKVSLADGSRYRVEIDGLEAADGSPAAIRFFVIFLADG